MHLRTFIRRLQKVVGPTQTGALPDAELLRRWVANRDPAAFEVLLWRHGPMVLGLCRRLLRHEQDAEDVFQSVFLALGLEARAISNAEAVAGWLYTVAYRAALQARAATARQPIPNSGVLDQLPAPAGEPTLQTLELRAVLDEEVGRLPAKYRDAFVLCHLEGLTNEEAARRLGRPVGTIVSRLARARQRLRARLVRRGLEPSAVVVLAPEVALAELPAPLVMGTTRAALFVAAGKAAEAVSPAVAALLQGVMRTMWIAKMKTVAALVLAVGLLSLAGGLLAYQTGGKAQAETPVEGPAVNASQKETGAPPAPMGLKGADPLPKPPPLAKKVGIRPPARAGAGDPRVVVARDEVELLKAQLEVGEARLRAAKIASEAAAEHLARLTRLPVRGAISEEQMSQARTSAALAQAQVLIRQAELREPQVRLAQATRRLTALEKASAPADERGRQLQRLRELEKKLDALRKEVEGLRRELDR